jgi:hypothetical protein
MSLKSSLMRQVNEGRIKSFTAHDDKRATIELPSGIKFLIYMPDHYIIGLTDVAEAAESPTVDFLVYNAWDTIGASAKSDAMRRGIQVLSYGEFSKRLDHENSRN